ncbi:MAG: lysophospholipid acyltransferase family protein [Candidatus Kapaibacteriales bacterium]
MSVITTYLKTLAIALVSLIFSVAVIFSMLILGKRVFHSFAHLWSKILLLIAGVKIKKKYSEDYNLANKSKPLILASNHTSFFDIPVVLATCGRNANIIYKEELEKVPVWGWGLKMSPFIAINRNSGRDSLASIDKAAAQMREGDSTIIFPEGTRSSELLPFKRGAFMLAARSGLPIVPVAISGIEPVLSTKPFRIRKATVTIEFGAPIDAPKDQNAATEKELMIKTRDAISEMLEERQE